MEELHTDSIDGGHEASYGLGHVLGRGRTPTNSFRISSQSDLFFLWHNRLQRSKGFKTFINIVYKRKADKIRPVDLDKSDNFTPSNNEN
jgi:hypothetical protein